MLEIQNSRVAWMATESIGLIRVNVGKPMSAYITGPVASYYCHWDAEERRTMPCLVSGCRRCRDGCSRRALSYVRVMHFRYYHDRFQWLPGILEVPFETGKALSSFCGQVLAFKRDRKFGPVNFGKFLFPQDAPTPVMFPLVPTLMRLWRVPAERQLALVGNSADLALGSLPLEGDQRDD